MLGPRSTQVILNQPKAVISEDIVDRRVKETIIDGELVSQDAERFRVDSEDSRLTYIEMAFPLSSSYSLVYCGDPSALQISGYSTHTGNL